MQHISVNIPVLGNSSCNFSQFVIIFRVFYVKEKGNRTDCVKIREIMSQTEQIKTLITRIWGVFGYMLHNKKVL